jgi:hypothetical protein
MNILQVFKPKTLTLKNKTEIKNYNFDWTIIDKPTIEPEKWNLVDPLTEKEKLKLILFNNYKKIISNIINLSPVIYYSYNLINKKNKYFNLISYSTEIFNIINKVDYLKIINEYANKSINIVNICIIPFIASMRLQYNYLLALKEAYNNLLNMCYYLVHPILFTINKKYNKSSNTNIEIKNINNEIIIIKNNFKYIFAYSQFLLNLSFQNDLCKKIKNTIDNLTISFIIVDMITFIINLNYEPNNYKK